LGSFHDQSFLLLFSKKEGLCLLSSSEAPLERATVNCHVLALNLPEGLNPMTPEERDIIGRFIARVGGAQQSGFSGSVPATQTALPPIDPEADRFIADQFNTNPQARYRITQMAFVQEAALAEAQNRIKRLEYDLQQAQQQQAQGGQRSGGLFGGLFGGGQSRPQPQPQYAPPPPQAVYPPGYQPGMFSGGGSGFLGSALTTAAGVAGGVLAADAITSMFSGVHGYGGGGWGGGGFGGGGFGGGEVINETVVNNYGPEDGGATADPWAGGGAAPDPSPSADPWSGGGGDAGGGDAWSGGGDSGGGWDDNSGGGDGGF